MCLLEVIHCVIQGDNSEDNVGFAVLVDAVDCSDHTAKSVYSGGDHHRDLVPCSRCLGSDVRRQLRLKGKNQRCICTQSQFVLELRGAASRLLIALKTVHLMPD